MGGTLSVALPPTSRAASPGWLCSPRLGLPCRPQRQAFLASVGPMLAEAADKIGELPVDILQMLFWSLDPWLASGNSAASLAWTRQATMPATLSAGSWLNEGAPLAGPVARECLVGWYGENVPGRGAWVVAAARSCRARSRRRHWS